MRPALLLVAALAALPFADRMLHAQATPGARPGVAPVATPDAALAAARAAWERNPENVDSIIWFGRRTGYTGAFQSAVDIYTNGLRIHPDEPRLLRHRGHRFISLRRYEWAIADLERARAIVQGSADEVEPDGQPNARGIPTSTLQSNIRYHLALAYFVTGQYARALPIWENDATVATNIDQRVAATYWWVLTLAHLKRGEEAKRILATIRADWDVIENGSYHRALLWMKGDLTEAQLLPAGASTLEKQTVGNGMGQWFAANGLLEQAKAAWGAVLATGNSASFGVLAAEAGMARLTNP